jgi:hypothetical protein
MFFDSENNVYKELNHELNKESINQSKELVLALPKPAGKYECKLALKSGWLPVSFNNDSFEIEVK